MLRSEATYQNKLITNLKKRFPGCFILKNDPEEYQGIPDLLILFGAHWAVLEVKLSSNSRVQPNQEHYIKLFNDLSFGAFICPENEKQVLQDLEYSFGLDW